MDNLLVPSLSLAYVASLFAVAWYGDRHAAVERDSVFWQRRTGLLYALTLAIYTTSWSFYGHIGKAASSGFDFVPIYLGPIFILIFGRSLLKRMIAVTKRQNITSLADFIAARYGKSRALGAAVTIAAVIALLPYIALQLKSVAATYEVLAGETVDGDTALVVTLAMILFSVLFGVRHIHASEHHRGLMLAIAFESVVKLLLFVGVALYIVYELGDGPVAIFKRAAEHPALTDLVWPQPGRLSWLSTIALSAICFLCLPQMFHVTVVENDDAGKLRIAAMVLPSYLIALALFMVPVAFTGVLLLGETTSPDLYFLALPLASGQVEIGLMAFIGGLSAATGMVIVAAVALSTMVCNDLVVPFLLNSGRTGAPGSMARTLLRIRRLSVTVILLLAYLVHLVIGANSPLATIGMISFVAVAQFGPSLLGGLFWQGGNHLGAMTGMAAGFLAWAYTLVLPTLAGSADFSDMGWLAPTALLGWSGPDPVTHATLWSLGLNLFFFVAASITSRPAVGEKEQAAVFVFAGPGFQRLAGPTGGPRISTQELLSLLSRFIGRDKALQAFTPFLVPAQTSLDRQPANAEALRFAEWLLAGAIGSASARVVIASLRVHDLSPSRAASILDDVSSAIEANHDLLRSTMESISQGICVLSADLRIQAWNRRFIDLLDLPEEIVRVGISLREVIAFNQARGEYNAEEFGALISNRDLSGLQWPYIYERSRPDGTVLEVCFTYMPDSGLVGTFTDVTERHQSAEALRAAKHELEERVRARTMELEDAKAAAEEANFSKTRFLAAASHDLLQPLNAARLFAAALSDSLQGEASSPEKRGHEKELAFSTEGALQSVEQLLAALLDISLLDSGAIKARTIDFAIDTVLERLRSEFSALVAERKLDLRVLPCRAVVRSDTRLFRRILQNFLSNALRYTISGKVLVGCRHVGDKLRIEVWDTGPGIPADMHQEIFKEFRRLHTDSDATRGLGLGLAIVERSAALLGHPVHMQSWLGRGSCFSVEVPLAQAAAAPVWTERAADGTPLSNLLVLCVDNETAIQQGMSALLTGWGCNTVAADCKEQALERLDGRIPDVVLIDYHLGDDRPDGLAALADLRQTWDQPVEALLVTADRSPKIRDAAARSGCAPLYKPVRPASLRSYLGRRSRDRACSG